MKIFLVGFMGSGKSTVGKKLANKLKLPFFDTDRMIEEQSGKSIPEIFEQDGENHFRELEKQLIRSFEKVENGIISTGGGLPCFNNNMTLMNAMGTTVYLHLELPEILSRLQKSDKKRPLLQHLSGFERENFIKKTLFEREIYYNNSHFTISGKSFSIQRLVDMLNINYL